MFKKFEKVVQGWKNWEKWAKMSAPKSAYIHYFPGPFMTIWYCYNSAAYGLSNERLLCE